MTNSMSAGTIEAPSLEMYDGKKVVVKQSPWDDVTFKSDLPHIARKLVLTKGRLEMHSRNLGTDESAKRFLTDDEVENLFLNENGVAILDKTESGWEQEEVASPESKPPLPVRYANPGNE
jgi:hypothetical protein